MKKVLLGLVALSSLAAAKEMVAAPVVAVEPAPVYVAPAPVYPAPYLNLRFGGDIAPRYKQANLDFDVVGSDAATEWFNVHSGAFGTKLNDKDGKGFGWEVAAEYMYPIKELKGLELGLGVAFQRHARFDSVNHNYSDDVLNILNEHGIEIGDELPPEAIVLQDVFLNIDTRREVPSFDSLPLYAVGKYKFDDFNVFVDGLKLYIKGDIGWSYNMERGSTRSSTAVSISADVPEGIIPDDFLTDFGPYGAYMVMDGHSKIENGLYWGAGIGLEYENWTFDVMYKVNTAKLKGEFRLPVGITTPDGPLFETKTSKFSEKIDYSRVTLSLGYKF